MKDDDELPGRVDLCLLVHQRRIDDVRAALAADSRLLTQHRWSGVHPLHRAVANGDVEMVALLLACGANASERAAWGWYTPLHLACKHGHEQIIWLLLEHGAAWSVTDKAKRTPLAWAVRAGKASIAYRVDQQLHARAKAARIAALEAPTASSMTSWGLGS